MSKITPTPPTPKKTETPPPAPQNDRAASDLFAQKQLRAKKQALQTSQQRQRQHIQLATQTRIGAQMNREEQGNAALARLRKQDMENPPGELTGTAFFDAFESRQPGRQYDDFKDQASGEDGRFAASESKEIAAAQAALDIDAIVDVLPKDKSSGIFEILMPNGDQLGVVISEQTSGLAYLLSPSSEKLEKQLRQHKMELETRLGRLTHRNVNITVL